MAGRERKVDWDRMFQNITDENVKFQLSKVFAWNAEAFVKHFNLYSKAQDTDSLRAMRIAVIRGTLVACKDLQYPFGPTSIPTSICANQHLIVEQAKATKFTDLTQKYEFHVSNIKETYNTVFEVIEADCLEQGIRLKVDLGLNPVVLNMASHRRPGGGYQNGAGAQEENLFRRTNYFQSLEDPANLDQKRKWGYPLPEFATIYSPSVFVFRSSEATGYGFLEKPVDMAFIACAAYARPKVIVRDGAQWLTDKFRDKTEQKMRGLIWTALVNNHDSIVLGAWGCGAFKNPPNHIAGLFRRVLNEAPFKGKFKHVVFAIFDDHNSRKAHNPKGNLQPFVEVFTPEMGQKGDVKVPAGRPASAAAAQAQPPVEEDDDADA